MGGLSPCMEELQSADRTHYLACLYLPSSIREDVAALWAFDAQVANIPLLVSEPLPGEIRIQWWRDVIVGKGDPNGAPIASALLLAIEKHKLPIDNFLTYLDARTSDLYQDAMPDMDSLEGYLGATHSLIFQMAAQCCGAKPRTELADTSGHAGVAYGLTRMLANIGSYHNRQQMLVPLAVAKSFGLNREKWLFDELGTSHLDLMYFMTNHASEHLIKALAAIEGLSKPERQAFRPLALTPTYAKKIRAMGLEPFKKPIEINPLSRFWHLFRGV